MKRSLFTKAIVLAVSGWVAVAAYAEYPDRPVTLVVPFAAGGPSDKIARDVAEALRKPMGQTIVVENAGGAGGTIGAARVARAKPDGYTLLVHHIGLATAPALYNNLPYETPGDFEFLGLINEAPSTLIGRPDLEANNFAELRDWIASNADKVNLANAGVGSASHLCALMLQSALKTKMVFVPYKGTAPAMNDLLGGQVDLMCEQATNSVPQIEGQKVKTFAVTSAERMQLPAILANTPTMQEAGLPGFNVQVWHGLYAPKGTPPEVLEKINAALVSALQNPDLVKRQEALGIHVIKDERTSPQGHKRFVLEEIERWTQVIKDSGVAMN